MDNPPDKQQRCVCGAVVHPDMYTICTRCKRNIVPQLADEALTSNQRPVPANLPQLLRDAERRVNEHVWGDRRAIVSIPADVSRDVDILLLTAADEIEQAGNGLDSLKGAYEAPRQRFAKACAEVTRLRGALEDYGQHQQKSCLDLPATETQFCYCGLTAAISADGSVVETPTELHKSHPALHVALCDLSQAIGNPALEVSADSSFEVELIKEATRRFTYDEDDIDPLGDGVPIDKRTHQPAQKTSINDVLDRNRDPAFVGHDFSPKASAKPRDMKMTEMPDCDCTVRTGCMRQEGRECQFDENGKGDGR